MAIQTKILNANGSKGHHKFKLTVNEESTSGNSSYMSYSFTIAPIQRVGLKKIWHQAHWYFRFCRPW